MTGAMSRNQLTLIQDGEFIVCDDVAYNPAPPAVLTASAALPVNTMKSVAVRLDDELVPLPFIRTQGRKVVSEKIRIEGPLATRIAKWLEMDRPTASSAASS